MIRNKKFNNRQIKNNLTRRFIAFVIQAVYLAVGIFFPITPAYSHSDHKKESIQKAPQILAPGYKVLDYLPPDPGSYDLPALGQAADGEVLDVHGRPRQLHSLFSDKFIVLSFIYSSCNDVNGCPLATYVLSRLQKPISEQQSFENKVRLISMSFDPANDTPSKLAAYSKNFIKNDFDWQFITTRSETELAPILAAYNQFTQKDYDENGVEIGTLSHILRVFLIDKENRIRNIYSVSFLHADTIINDIQTLLLEDKKVAISAKYTHIKKPTLYNVRKNEKDYTSPYYQTSARSLTDRIGKRVDLLQYVTEIPLGLPKVTTPTDNPITPAKVELGRKLFYDRRLSHNDTLSCA